MKLDYANINFTPQGTPVSELFDDVYFSNDDGAEETEYVFIQGNELDEQWLNFNHAQFVIGETGFGSGLNIMLCAARFLAFKQANPEHPLKRLHFFSFEKYPIAPDQLAQIAKARPQLAVFYEVLLSQYPLPIQGKHRLNLHEQISLDLIFGDISETASKVYCNEGLANAWFLDGFAPSKNESMWQDKVFDELARLSRPSASFATFTAAGVVKRGLAKHGFEVNKRKGFGKKRDMLVGRYLGLANDKHHKSAPKPWFYRESARDSKSVSIVGGGIAGFCSALALLKKGSKVKLFTQSSIADGASGNLVGGFYPQLQADYSHTSRFYLASFEYARHYYTELATRHSFDHAWCGVLQLAFNQNVDERQHKMFTRKLWPAELVEFVNREQATSLAKLEIPYSAMWIKNGGWISPKSLVSALKSACESYGGFSLEENAVFSTILEASDEQVKLAFNINNKHCEHISDAAVMAMGDGSKTFFDEQIDFRLTRGQVEYIPSNAEFSMLSSVVCHKGYFTPAYNNIHALGSTYRKNDISTVYNEVDKLENKRVHIEAMQSQQWQSFIDKQVNHDNKGRAAIRCSSPDHLPVVGNLPDIKHQSQNFANLAKFGQAEKYAPAKNYKNVFLLTALGSRGLTTAPMCAEIIANQVTQEALPLSADLLDAVNPNRFLIRKLFRQAHS